MQQAWCKIWNLNIPPIIKHLAWRILHNSLPTKWALFPRTKIGDGLYIRYGNRELVDHNFEEEDLDRFWITCWAIWYARNQLCFNNVVIPCEQILNLCNKTMSEFKSANENVLKSAVREDVKWTKHESGWVKINSDAGLSRNSNMLIPGGQTAIEAEAEAMLWGLKIAKDLPLRLLIMESDNSQLISATNQGTVYINELGNVLEEITRKAQNFEEIKWSFSPRKMNSLAHALAADSSEVEGKIWTEDLPKKWLHLWYTDNGIIVSHDLGSFSLAV
ncbi:uncharacterized protein LOC126656922 [Mercurialis annua]|uniref:uncharacterized protein LOC126656922 n=1 Tax=Mercurialis annua TaxID=3986 RepID=UPI00215F702B|nr:uncharacterized protein LOC126656922 [Mercurialis annua]